MNLKDAIVLAFNYLENNFKCTWTTGKGSKNKLIEAFSQSSIPKHVFLGYAGSDGIRHSFNRAIPNHNKPKGVLWETWLLSNIGMFLCHSCNEVLPLTKASKSGGGNSCCKPCDSIRTTDSSNIVRDYIYNLLKQSSCKDCGISNPIVLEFDHINPGEKLFNIGASYSKSLKLVIEEVKKCEIVCANCHRIRTAKQFNYYSYKRSME